MVKFNGIIFIQQLLLLLLSLYIIMDSYIYFCNRKVSNKIRNKPKTNLKDHTID